MSHLFVIYNNEIVTVPMPAETLVNKSPRIQNLE